MKNILITILLTCTLFSSFAQQSPQIIFLSKGDTKEAKQVFHVLDRQSEEIKRGRHLFGSGWAAQSANIYMMAQRYLMHTHQLNEVLPLFVILDPSSDYSYGKGITYSDGKNIIELPEAWYIKIHPQIFENDRGSLDAPQLIFSEATGCIVANLMLGEHQISAFKFSNKTPYFSVPTDYSTALIHGYGLYWRYLNHEAEPNPITRTAMAENMNTDKREISRNLFGFERDMRHLYRLGLYTFLMPHWAPIVERTKSITFVKNNWARLPSRSLENVFSDKATYYRDAAFLPNPQGNRNYYQLYESSGVVANFFGILLKSNVGNTVIDPAMASLFTGDTAIGNPKGLDPLTNSNIKFLLTFIQMKNNAGVDNHSIGGFINTYYNLFRQDSADVVDTWRKISAQDFKPATATELWVEIPNVRWVKDIAYPYNFITDGYRFNLNTADSIDLMQIPGFTPQMAEEYIKARSNAGFFTDINQVIGMPFLSQPIKDFINKSLVTSPSNLTGNQKIITSEASFNAHMSLVFGFFILWIAASIILLVPFIIWKRPLPWRSIFWHAFSLFILYIVALGTITTDFRPLLTTGASLIAISAVILYFNRKEDWIKWVRVISFVIPALIVVLSAL